MSTTGDRDLAVVRIRSLCFSYLPSPLMANLNSVLSPFGDYVALSARLPTLFLRSVGPLVI